MAPGRDDLIAANSARINTAVNSPSKQTGNLAGATSSAGTQSYSGPRSRMGGNLDVVSTLDSIVFQGKEGDASMRGNVAYIRRWKRGNTAQQAGPGGAAGGTGSLQDVASFAGIFGPQSTLNQDIKSVFSPENQKWLQELPSWDSSIGFTSTYIDENLRLSGDAFKDKFQAFVPGNYGRLAALEAFTPTTKLVPGGNQANNSVVVATPGNAQSTAESTTVKTAETPVTGNLKSANPNGFVNALNKVGRSALGLPPAPPTYAGDVNSLGKAAPLPDGMWQFLFNPSELELEAGPEFKSAETWGVSDKSNSGQPLHWSHNKNAVLKFNSVLLNGFVFGRKVEALEQGLLELFMARDGDGQDGPHVLEFVWGKRVFGPCVIKNVSVKEKQWDEGEVVNAELSFTLEQVPEWTINDGFVDVARPGRQPTVAAPDAPATTPAASAGTGSPGSTPSEGTGTGAASGQKPATPQQQEDFIGCRNLQQLKFNAAAFNPAPGTYAITYSGGLIPGIGSGAVRGAYQSNFSRNYNSYNSFVAKGNTLGVSTSTKCAPSAIKAEHDRLTRNSNDSLKEAADKQMASFMNSCAAELGSKAGGFFDQKGCKRFADGNKPI
jgi:hypothetical protein